jgi:hypothetical protein
VSAISQVSFLIVLHAALGGVVRRLAHFTRRVDVTNRILAVILY